MRPFVRAEVCLPAGVPAVVCSVLTWPLFLCPDPRASPPFICILVPGLESTAHSVEHGILFHVSVTLVLSSSASEFITAGGDAWRLRELLLIALFYQKSTKATLPKGRKWKTPRATAIADVSHTSPVVVASERSPHDMQTVLSPAGCARVIPGFANRGPQNLCGGWGTTTVRFPDRTCCRGWGFSRQNDLDEEIFVCMKFSLGTSPVKLSSLSDPQSPREPMGAVLHRVWFGTPARPHALS